MRRVRLALLISVLAIASVPVALALAATSSAPAATSAQAQSITDTGATLNGSVNPNGSATQYGFQYGPTTAYGEETSVSDAGSGTAAQSESAALTGLNPGTTYHFRMVAINAAGTSTGADETFTTTGTAPSPSTAPTAVTSPAGSIGQSGATLNGTVDPDSQATTYHFEYGTTTDYGYSTSGSSAGSGSSPATATAQLSGLQPSTTYHYRVVAVSPGGVTVGNDATFTTTTPPTVTSTGASDITYDAATFNGTVNPQGQGSSYYFQYGTGTSYGLQTAPASAGSGTGVVSVHATATGLMPGTTYHYRLVATSAGGTSYGADETASTTGTYTAPSTVKLMGHMGFVSPGNVIGVELGCFNGTTKCSGTFTMTVNGRTIGSGTFTENAESGMFRNFKLNSTGVADLKGNRVNHLLATTVTIVTTSGQHLSGRLSLARWKWTD